MVEYINSNDDAGNLALYGGIGVAAFAGGAALAYRATSPIYKKGKGGSKGKDSAVAESVVAPTVGADDAPKLGALAHLKESAPAKGILGRIFTNPAETALNNTRADAIDAMTDVMGAGGRKEAEINGLKSKQGDIDYVGNMLKNNPDMSSTHIMERLYDERPNTLVNLKEVERKRSRMSRKDLQARRDAGHTPYAGANVMNSTAMNNSTNKAIGRKIDDAYLDSTEMGQNDLRSSAILNGYSTKNNPYRSPGNVVDPRATVQKALADYNIKQGNKEHAEQKRIERNEKARARKAKGKLGAAIEMLT